MSSRGAVERFQLYGGVVEAEPLLELLALRCGQTGDLRRQKKRLAVSLARTAVSSSDRTNDTVGMKAKQQPISGWLNEKISQGARARDRQRNPTG